MPKCRPIRHVIRTKGCFIISVANELANELNILNRTIHKVEKRLGIITRKWQKDSKYMESQKERAKKGISYIFSVKTTIAYDETLFMSNYVRLFFLNIENTKNGNQLK